ncbi:5242_t:CDS:2 [Scutellospora calospora]|uniref:5242_t:CDS:1 n=1 Tax=Scutellospora calospora TaxID=85575 RepID=A0ACA9JTU9_9GLOM|nr:5242_t:CDS:2 [Scutellospora calospora]
MFAKAKLRSEDKSRSGIESEIKPISNCEIDSEYGEDSEYDFDFIQRIEQGAFGIVFKAEWIIHKLPVVLKIFKPELNSDQDNIEKIFNEEFIQI